MHELYQGPVVLESYRSPDDLYIIRQWLQPRIIGQTPDYPHVSKSGDWKIYPTIGEDWSNTPKEVWNPNAGGCYPKWHIEQSIKIQLKNEYGFDGRT